MAGSPPSPASHSFADVLCTSSKDASFFKPASLHRGEPALIYSKEEVSSMSADLKFTLVGKFSRGRPPMESLRKSFLAFDFKGPFKLGLLDSRHILIRFDLEEDYLRLRLRKFFNFDGFAMRLFKWTPQFRLDVESTWVPVWVRFDHLPLYLFNKGSLFSLGRILGEPLKIDAATTSLSRPSTARICVDLDLMKQQPTRVWIDDGNGGFWQPIEYEDMPKYCLSCFKVGHSLDKCVRRKADNHKEKGVLSNQIWFPKVSKVQGTKEGPLFAAEKSSTEVQTAEIESAMPAAAGKGAVAEAVAAELAVAVGGDSNHPEAADYTEAAEKGSSHFDALMTTVPFAMKISNAAASQTPIVEAVAAPVLAEASGSIAENDGTDMKQGADITHSEISLAGVADRIMTDSTVLMSAAWPAADSNQNLATGAAGDCSALVAPVQNDPVSEIDDAFKNFSPIPRTMPFNEPTAKYPTRAQIFKELKDSYINVMRLNIPKAQSTALVPIDNVVEATPLAFLAPSQSDSIFAEANSFQSQIESGDFCDYTDDIDVESSYFQQLTPYRGRGKKNQIVALSNTVLRPRKNTLNKS